MPMWLPLLLVVVALHLLLLQLAQQALRATPIAITQPTATLVLLPPSVVPRKALPSPPPPPSEPKPRLQRLPDRAPPTPPAAAPRVAAPAASPAPGAATATAAVPDAAPAHAAASASAPGALLDSEATRNAVRELARKPSMAELGAQATGAAAPLSEQQRLGNEIARGAIGDCLKGEYAGSGMGLLSLPFWLMAELREKCRR